MIWHIKPACFSNKLPAASMTLARHLFNALFYGLWRWYQPALWCMLVRSNIEHDCVFVCAFKHAGLKKDLSTEQSIIIITSDGSHTSRLHWNRQQHHCMYWWLMIWLCDMERTLTSILELLYLMYVMCTGRNSRAGAICHPNEQWWRSSLADEGLETALTINMNISHTHL